MQHTDKYQLDLIETSDTFSPAPLNENMQKVEAALETKAAAADHAALDQRVQVLEAHKVAAGTYVGDGTGGTVGHFIELGFTPRAVVIQRVNTYACMAVAGRPYGASIVIVENGFTVSGTGSPNSTNEKGFTYAYLAVL